MLTLETMRRAILHDWSWCVQRGPDDVTGHERDTTRRREIRKARSWNELCQVCPIEWRTRVANRELIQDGD